MVFVPGERKKKPNPKILSFNDYKEYANNGKTIAGVSKLRNFHEAQCREHIKESYPSLLEQYNSNQLAKYKTTHAKILKASKPVIVKEVKEPVHNGLKLDNNYRDCIKLYRYCVVCINDRLVIAHIHNKEVPENIQHCPRCNELTTVEDVQLDVYRKLILLKHNHLSSIELLERKIIKC